jgi:uncharacterized protein
MIPRPAHSDQLRRLLKDNRVVGLVGARQVGKTTLANAVAKAFGGPSETFDLEDPRDLAVLSDPMLALAETKGLVVIDEIQFRPDLFSALRVLADRPRGARFLVLGSASGDLLRQGAESLAGRIAWHELPPLGLQEVGIKEAEKLWLRGGFPRSFTARSAATCSQWRRDFVRTFLERDLARMGIGVPAAALGRFWAMLAHWHAQTMNWSELARALGSADNTIRRYVDLLEATFMLRQLQPWHQNLAKRQVKAPKVYIRDTGLLHTLLEIHDKRELLRHPKVGASWEGFCIDEVARALGARPEECYFWGTHSGAELDLLVIRGSQRRAFEIKRSTTPRVTPSMQIALQDLGLSALDVIHAGEQTFQLTRQIRAVSWRHIHSELNRLR